MIDISFLYFYEEKDAKYIEYFVNQRNSLNAALQIGAYEKIKDGNGTYENFRSSYRALNWLEIHNRFLGEKNYSDKDQLKTIATFLQQGAHFLRVREIRRPEQVGRPFDKNVRLCVFFHRASTQIEASRAEFVIAGALFEEPLREQLAHCRQCAPSDLIGQIAADAVEFVLLERFATFDNSVLHHPRPPHEDRHHTPRIEAHKL